MSSIDQRIVGMQFDNSQFERGVKESLKSIEQLKDNLDFSKAEKSMDGLQKAGNSFSLTRMANGVESLANRFSTLGIVGMRVLENLADKATNAGERLVKSLTTDQIGAGFSKYEEYSKSMKTIMSATEKPVAEVQSELDKLLWFTDETSYSLLDMTNNIGKFTSNGVDLTVATSAMMGIANASALAGSGIESASHAMEGFSKGIAQGKMTRATWQWVKTARMDTKKFKETVIEAAVEVGTLQKKGDKFVTKKGTAVSYEDFETAMTEGWFNKDVILKALGSYGDFAGKLYEMMQLPENAGKTTSEVLGELGGEYDGLGLEAFKAAQEARTFTDAIQSVKDAVSTGWMKTFELVIGDTEQATELWTDLANGLWEVFAAGGESRNALLTEWNELGGRKDLIQGLYDTFDGLVGILDLVKSSFHEIFPEATVDDLLKISSAVKDFGANLKNAFEIKKKFDHWEDEEITVVHDKIEDLNEELKRGAKGDDVERMQKRLMELGFNLDKYGADGIFGPETQAALKDFQEKYGLTVSGIYDEATHLKMADVLGLDGKAETKMQKVAKYIDEMPPGLEHVQSILKGLFAILSIGAKGLSFVGNVLGIIGNVLRPFGDALLTIGAAAGDALVSFNDWLGQSTVFSDALVAVQNFFKPVSEWITNASQALVDFVLGTDAFGKSGNIVESLKSKWQNLLQLIRNTKVWQTIQSVLDRVRTSFSNALPSITETLKGFFKGLIPSIRGFVGKIPEFLRNIGGFFSSLWRELKGSEKIQSAFSKVKEVLQKVKNFFEEFIGKFSVGLQGLFSKHDNSETLSESLKSRFEAFDKLGVWLRDTWHSVTQLFSSLIDSMGPFVKTALKTVKSAGLWILLGLAIFSFARMFSKITSAFDTLKGVLKSYKKKTKPLSDSILDIAKGIALIAASIFVLGQMDPKKLRQGLLSIVGIIGALLILGFITSKINDFKKIGDSLWDIGKAIGVLALTLIGLSMISWTRFGNGLLKMVALMTVLGSFIIAVNKLGASKVNYKGLVSVAFSVGVLALVIVGLSKMDKGNYAKGLFRLIGVMVVLGSFIIAVNRFGGRKVQFGGLIGLATAVGILAGIVVLLGNLNPTQLKQGILGLTLIIGALAAFSFLTSKFNTSGIAKGALAVAGSLLIIAAAIGLIVWGLGMIDEATDGGLTRTIQRGGEVIESIAKTLNPFGWSIKTFGIVIGALLAACTGAGFVAGKMLTGALAISGTLGIIASAIALIIAGLGALDSISIDGTTGLIERGCQTITTIGNTLAPIGDNIETFGIVIGALLAACTGAGFVAGKMLTGALAISGTLGIIASAIALIIAGLGALDSISIDGTTGLIERGCQTITTIGNALAPIGDNIETFGIVIGAVLAACTAGGFAAGPMLTGALAISGTLGIIAASVSLIMGGLGALDQFTDGAVVEAIEAGGEVLSSIGEALGSFVGSIGGSVVGSFKATEDKIEKVGFAETFGAFANEMSQIPDTTGLEEKTTSAIAILDSISTFSAGLEGKTIGDAISDFFTGTPMDNLEDKTTKFAESINGLVSGLSKITVDDATTSQVESSVNIAEKVAGFLAKLSTDDYKIDKDKFFGLIGSNVTEFKKRIGEFGKAINDFAIKASANNIDPTVAESFANSLGTIADALAKVDKMANPQDSATNLTSQITEISNAFSGEGAEQLKTAAATLTSAVSEGMKVTSIDTTGIAGICDAALLAVNGYEGKFKSAGQYLSTGLAKGIARGGSLVIAAAIGVATAAIVAARAVLAINSPSKVFSEIGMGVDEGFAKGINDFAGMVTTASKDVANNVIDSVHKPLMNLTSLITDDMDYDPVIRPVIDLTSVQNGARAIGGILGGHYRIGLNEQNLDNAASAARGVAAVTSRARQNENVDANSSSGFNNQDSSVNLTGNNFYVRSEQDIRSLASEIAGLTKQQQRSLGSGI